MHQSIIEIKNKSYELYREQCEQFNEIDNLFKTYIVNDGTISKALEYVLKYCGFNVKTDDHLDFASRACMIMSKIAGKLNKRKTYDFFFKVNAVLTADRNMPYFNSLSNRSITN